MASSTIVPALNYTIHTLSSPTAQSQSEREVFYHNLASVFGTTTLIMFEVGQLPVCVQIAFTVDRDLTGHWGWVVSQIGD